MKYSRWLALILIMTILLSVSISFYALYQTRADEATFARIPSVSPLVARSTPLGDAAPSMRLSLSINLSLRNTADLARYLQAEYTPASYLYHHYLQPAEFAALYGPTVQDVRQVASFLRSQGFSATHAVAGQQVIDFSGTVAQAEQAFAVQIHTYRAGGGRVFYANSTAPRVPLGLRPLIVNINGLDNAVLRAHPPLHGHSLAGPTRSPRAIVCPGPGSNAA